MHDGLNSAQRGLQCRGHEDVALDDLDGQPRQQVEGAPGPGKDTHAMTGVSQSAGDIGTEKTGRSGDENKHVDGLRRR